MHQHMHQQKWPIGLITNFIGKHRRQEFLMETAATPTVILGTAPPSVAFHMASTTADQVLFLVVLYSCNFYLVTLFVSNH